MKNTTWVISVLLVICLWCNVVQCYHARQADEAVRIDTVEQVAFVEVHDTVPAQTAEKVIGKVNVSCGHINGHSVTDSVTSKQNPNAADTLALEIVQRTFSDSATYTYGRYPSLDSIIVRQKIIERTITNTLRERHKVSFKIRPAVGVGYGMFGQRIDVYVGVAGVIDF